MQLRATTASDAALLASLQLDAYRGQHADWDADYFRTLLVLPTTHGFVIEESGQPLGFVLWVQTEEFGEVITLAVQAVAQRRGLGKKLLAAYEAALSASSVAQSILDVAEDNLAAQFLYARVGYAEINRRPGYYRTYEQGRERRADALVLQKLLTL